MRWSALDPGLPATICIAVASTAAFVIAVGRILGPADADAPPPSATLAD